MTLSLKERTRELLRNTTLSNRQIANELEVSVPWVKMFRDGEIKSPNVDVVQKLYEHLTGETLFQDRK